MEGEMTWKIHLVIIVQQTHMITFPLFISQPPLLPFLPASLSLTWSVRKDGLYVPSAAVLPLPLRDFMWDTAMRRMVSLSGFRANALQVGTMSDSSVM